MFRVVVAGLPLPPISLYQNQAVNRKQFSIVDTICRHQSVSQGVTSTPDCFVFVNSYTAGWQLCELVLGICC